MPRGMNANIHKAAEDGNILELRRYGQGSLLDFRTVKGDSVLQTHIRHSISHANAGFILSIIAYCPRLLFAKNDAEDNAFHSAAMAGRPGVVRLLLEQGGGGYATMVNKAGDTPLHIASRMGNLEVVQELLCGNPGVDPDYVYTANAAGETPLSLAAEGGFNEIVDLLKEKIPNSIQCDILLGCPLHPAVLLKDEGLLEKIMSLDKSFIMVRDGQGQTPLHHAALQCWPEGMKRLSGDNAEAVLCQDNKKRTAAHIAAEINNVSGLEVLVDLRRDCCEAPDDKQQNVAHYAARCGSGEVFKYLLEDALFINLMYEKDVDGNTPLHLFAESIPWLKADTVTFMQRNNVISLIQKRMKRTFNNKNCTPGDIAAKHLHDPSKLEPSNHDLLRKFLVVAPRSNRNKDSQENVLLTNLIDEDDRKQKALTVKSRAKIYMSISLAFIAITAACLIQVCSSGLEKFNDLSNGGTSILSKYASQAFFIFILISLMVSVLSSIFNAMVLIKNGRGFWMVGRCAFFLTVIISPVSLLMAIMALLYATKQISGISLSIMGVISGIFVLVCCVIVAGVFRFWEGLNSENISV